MGVGSLVGISSYLFYRVNHLPDLGISSSDASMLNLFVPVLLEFVWVFWVWHYTVDESGKTFSYHKGKIFGVHIRYVNIRRTKPLNDSEINNLAS